MPWTVLVVDDDPAFRALAARLLGNGGFTVIGEAGGVVEGSALAAQLKPHLALVDIALPDGNGFDLAVQLSAMPVPIRVVLISADSDAAFGPAAQRAGARGFLPKDELTPAALVELLGR